MELKSGDKCCVCGNDATRIFLNQNGEEVPCCEDKECWDEFKDKDLEFVADIIYRLCVTKDLLPSEATSMLIGWKRSSQSKDNSLQVYEF